MSICFVALRAYNTLSGREDLRHIGGAEVQQVLIASSLMRLGHSVSLVTLDHGQPDGVTINGIRVFKAYAAETGIRGLRFVYPRWWGLWKAMARANADVYYQRGAECETGQVGLWCRLHGRRFVFAAANESDCDSSLYALTSWKDRALYRLGLRLADAITAQTATQQRLLRQNMGVSASLMRNLGWNAGEGTSGEQGSSTRPARLGVLWVGRFGRQKRLEWLLDVAVKCPEISFTIVGAAGVDSKYASSLVERAQGISNVTLQGQVPYHKMVQNYRRSQLLCCTSTYEGFPNVFLEAWSLGIPVVSTFDPDGVIAAHGLGWVVADVEGIVACLRKIEQSPEILREASRAAKQYYLANHAPEVCLPAFEQLLRSVAG